MDRMRGGGPDHLGKITGIENAAVGQYYHPLDHIPQLSHVAGPRIRLEKGKCLSAEVLFTGPQVYGKGVKEVLCQRLDITSTIPQRRKFDMERVDPVQEIPAELTACDKLSRFLFVAQMIFACTSTCIPVPRGSIVLFSIRRRSFGCTLQRQVPDLVKKESAPFSETDLT